MYTKDLASFAISEKMGTVGHEFLNDESMSFYTKYEEGNLDQSHIYSDLMSEKKGQLSEHFNFSEQTQTISTSTRRPNYKVIQLRFCAFVVLMGMFLSSGLTAVCFLLSRNTESNQTCPHKTLPTQSRESVAYGDHTISFMRSTCPVPWFHNILDKSCYHLFEDKKTWFQSSDYCRNIGADLISIPNDMEANALNSYINFSMSGSRQRYWIGLNDLEEENNFVWSDGSMSGWTRWGKKEPNNYNELEDCTEVSEENLWNDANCYLPRGFICKIYLTDKCGDGDWLLFDDHCYFFGKENKTREEAQRWCEENGSNLTTVDSISKHSFIIDRALTTLSGHSWIGLENIAGMYTWADGQIADTENIPWGQGHPIENNNCVFLGGHGNFLSAQCTDEVNGYICEKHIF